jgi:hypothetical protein
MSQNPNICPRFLLIIITFIKKTLQMFCATYECDSDSKKLVFLTKTDGYPKKCDTKKNMTQMGMIIKGGLLQITKLECQKYLWRVPH